MVKQMELQIEQLDVHLYFLYLLFVPLSYTFWNWEQRLGVFAGVKLFSVTVCDFNNIELYIRLNNIRR